MPRITAWHHEACRVMTIGDPEGKIFLSHPHTNNRFCFLLTTKYLILYWKKHEKDFQKILNTLRYHMVTMTSLIAGGCLLFILPMGWYEYIR